MSLKPEGINKLIKDQIRRYDEDLEIDETGTIITVGDDIALIYGLQGVVAGELLRFPGDIYGMVLSLEEEHVGAILMGDDSNIREGDEVKHIGRIVEVPAGSSMLEHIVNALGQAIDGGEPIKSDKFRPVRRATPDVVAKKSIHQPVQTGLETIDSVTPIGRSQRGLIIGDRRAGKTATAIGTIINQKNNNIGCIYIAIGQKASTVAQIVEKLRPHGAMECMTIASSTTSEPAPLQYTTPCTGRAIGEEWMENGDDMLIVYDDSSKYAVAYRTMSLPLKYSPGREAYPGDVFYLHPRLPGRAAKLNGEPGAESLTALPIIETQVGDISAYTPTNVISITDGQIFPQVGLFNNGARPVIDSGLSVSRVDNTAQIEAMKQVSGSLKLELAQFHGMQAFARFESNLDTATTKILAHGERLTKLLVQNQYDPFPVTHQVLTLFAVKSKFLEPVKTEGVQLYEKEMLKYMERNHTDTLTEIEEKQALNDTLSASIRAALQAFEAEFRNMIEG